MSTPLSGPVTLSLVLDPGAGPIAGVLASDSERIEFTGWIELAALIEARRGEGVVPEPDPSDLTGPGSSPASPPQAPPAS